MKASGESVDQSRRSFLRTGSLVVSFALFAPATLFAKKDTLGTEILAANLPGSLKSNPMLDAWIRIDEQGISVYSGKVELGTGVRTALWQIAADQLAVPLEAIHFVTADTGLTPNEGYTAGSHTMADGGTAIYNASAQVRKMLLDAAAKKLNTTANSLSLKDGTIIAQDGRTLTYAKAVEGINLHKYADPVSPSSDPAQYRYIGKSIPRVDIPSKVTGGPAYVQDMRLPGMLHARVVRPPSRGAVLEEADIDGTRRMSGVVAVVRDGNYLAVVANNEWQAVLAMRALQQSAKWRPTRTWFTPDRLHQVLKELPHQDFVDANQPMVAGANGPRVKATTTKQYLHHGSIGPSCAIAHLDGDTLTVWTHTQGVFPLRAGLAGMLNMPLEKVRCIHVEGSGCYGHNGADDAAADAALIAMRVPGKPIRVQWMRDQEQMWEPFGAAMITELDASLDSSGHLANWHYELWSTAHNERITNPGRLMPTWLLAKSIVPDPSVPIPQPEGDADRNAIPPYRIPGLQVTMHFVTEMPFRTSAQRSLGAHVNVTAMESAMDEFAAATGKDAIAFRLEHLDDPRAKAVIELARDKFDWATRLRNLPSGGGVGFAFSRYKNIMGYCAIAMELHIDEETREIRFPYIVAAADCGQVVNPDGLRNQLEGGIVQSISWTLHEQVLFDKDGVKSVDWAAYPSLRFNQIPDVIETFLIDQPGNSFLGAAEIAQAPTAAALVNAMARATGTRSHRFPVMRNPPFAS